MKQILRQFSNVYAHELARIDTKKPMMALCETYPSLVSKRYATTADSRYYVRRIIANIHSAKVLVDMEQNINFIGPEARPTLDSLLKDVDFIIDIYNLIIIDDNSDEFTDKMQEIYKNVLHSIMQNSKGLVNPNTAATVAWDYIAREFHIAVFHLLDIWISRSRAPITHLRPPTNFLEVPNFLRSLEGCINSIVCVPCLLLENNCYLDISGIKCVYRTGAPTGSVLLYPVMLADKEKPLIAINKTFDLKPSYFVNSFDTKKNLQTNSAAFEKIVEDIPSIVFDVDISKSRAIVVQVLKSYLGLGAALYENHDIADNVLHVGIITLDSKYTIMFDLNVASKFSQLHASKTYFFTTK